MLYPINNISPSIANLEGKKMYSRPGTTKQSIYALAAFILFVISSLSSYVHAGLLDRTGTMWAPYIEWTLDNTTYSGNPFDLVASVTFTHSDSGETHITEMFYAGGTNWKFRFTGTRTGLWSFNTTSSDPQLSGQTGTVTISVNSNPTIKGFVTTSGNKWARQEDENSPAIGFLPQFRMAFTESPGIWTPENIDAKILTHMGTEGFNGIFFFVGGRWVDLNSSGAVFTNNDPDLEMFQILENLITKTHAAGGVVHFWYSGDCSRNQCVQAGFGTNGARSDGEKRLLRYIGARLSPLPGWIMGYGYDIVEDTTTTDLRGWGNYLRSKMGWNHLLSARDQSSSYGYSFWPEADWYSKGNFFNGATYTDVAGVFDSDTSTPHSFDERWWTSRINENDQRRLMWTTMMAGGVSAIWGSSGTAKADPYVDPNGFKTYFTFWEDRTMNDFVRDNSLSNGYAIRSSNSSNFIFYATDTTSIAYNISGAPQNLPVIAIDTKKSYSEINLGTKPAGSYTWIPPYISDWAISAGGFDGVVIAPPTPPKTPSGETLLITP
ncbi:MAG: DUF5060 domain-containing protein [Ectothiorhodospiraceae bacterium]|nr:DUF5060 domain-containing protein [Ectothiorhodospiraceae bacterium]